MRVVENLGEPYGKCTEKNDKTENIFGGGYTQSKCFHTRRLKHTWNTCGAVPYQYRKYAEKFPESSNKDNYTADELIKCINHAKGSFYKTDISTQVCAEECSSASFPIQIQQISYSGSNGNINRLVAEFSYNQLQKEVIQQFPETEFETVLANFGGTLGLTCGISFISILEIIIFFGLLIIECIRKKH